MSDYTPTTEEVRRVARTLSTCREFDPEMCDGCDKRVQEAERLLNSRWLAEVKAQNWRELRGHLVDDFDNHPDTFWAEDGDGNQVEVISLSSVIELVNGKYGMGETK